MAGWQERKTQTRASETPAERVFNDIVEPMRSLTGHMYAHKKAAMIQDGTITRMGHLDAVVVDAWPGARTEPDPNWEWLSYSLTFAEAVPCLYPGEYDDPVVEILSGISEDPLRPGAKERGKLYLRRNPNPKARFF